MFADDRLAKVVVLRVRHRPVQTGALVRLDARLRRHQSIPPVVGVGRHPIGGGAAGDLGLLRQVAVADTGVVVLALADLHQVGPGGVRRAPEPGRRHVIGPDPSAHRPAQAVVNGAVNRAAGRHRLAKPAAVVVGVRRSQVVGPGRAERHRRGRVGHPGEVGVLVGGDHLADRVQHLPAQRLHTGDRLGPGRPTVDDGGRGRHRQRLGVAPAAILADDRGRPGGEVRGAVPAGVDARLVGGVLVHGIGDVAVRVGRLGRPALVVKFVGRRLLQAAAGWGRPAAGQVGKRAGLRGVDIADRLGHTAGDIVVGGVVQVAGRVFRPDHPAAIVHHGDVALGRV